MDAVDPARLLISGPGRAVAGAVAQAHAAGARSIILAGFCAGLAATPIAPPISEVRTEAGASYTPTVRAGPGPGAATLVGVDRIIATPGDKAWLRQNARAELADMESHHFAAACAECNLPWGVVRAVSDGPETSMPPETMDWIDPMGRMRTSQVLIDVLRRPKLAPQLRTLARDSRRAAAGLRDAVAEAIR